MFIMAPGIAAAAVGHPRAATARELSQPMLQLRPETAFSWMVGHGRALQKGPKGPPRRGKGPATAEG